MGNFLVLFILAFARYRQTIIALQADDNEGHSHDWAINNFFEFRLPVLTVGNIHSYSIIRSRFKSVAYLLIYYSSILLFISDSTWNNYFYKVEKLAFNLLL